MWELFAAHKRTYFKAGQLKMRLKPRTDSLGRALSIIPMRRDSESHFWHTH